MACSRYGIKISATHLPKKASKNHLEAGSVQASNLGNFRGVSDRPLRGWLRIEVFVVGNSVKNLTPRLMESGIGSKKYEQDLG